MLTEKSVELNVTSEILNFLSARHGRSFYALGPSLQAEASLGFDVSVRAPGQAILIQFKRAYPEKGGALSWKLNRTKAKDQHARLQALQKKGLPVYYALPRFHTAAELSNFRYRLLRHTSWWPPLAIMPAGGPTGHHEVHWEPSLGRWTVSSDEPAPIGAEPADPFAVLAGTFERSDGIAPADLARVVFETLLEERNAIVLEGDEVNAADLTDAFDGLAIIGWSEGQNAEGAAK